MEEETAHLGNTGEFDDLSGEESDSFSREKLIEVLTSIYFESTEECIGNRIRHDGY